MPESSPLVSIIIPFRDEVHYLEEALSSCLTQEITSKEIIVVCNNPVMISSPPIKYLEHPEIKWFHEPVQGSAYARNKGLSNASGTWIQFLDVDDLILPAKIKSQLKFDQADVIVSPHTYRFIKKLEVPSSWNPHDIWTGLLASQIGSTSSMLWRKSSLIKVGGWSPDYISNQEYELIFRLLTAGCIVMPCEENLTIVRERASGSITKETQHKALFGIRLREKIREYLVSTGQENPERFNAFRSFIFKNLRALYISDPLLALNLHEKYFSAGSFRPKIPGIPFYGLLYRILGFQKTEELMDYYRRIRKKYARGLPYNK